ncbi:helix-turn-helix domain-containing protein [Kribbella sp. CA-293567]|uniref:helix-turn-helix domain-containing protein n=1 Tax=Kribbella sp. CA-293567 TaxID=3002436 RepID=UPI0022DD0B24|nr:helix-turn-helix domain-containing protein [Kribbella sp. CA-293567]WBQ05698.1 helix-turn-helix domain-containing protein [Kribbella sp. CA-293567]
MEIRTPHALGAAARGRRRQLHLTQAAVAEAAGVSRAWLTAFEAGKPTVEVGRVLAVVAALGIAVDLRVEEPSAASSGREPTDLDSLLDEYDEGRDDRV